MKPGDLVQWRADVYKDAPPMLVVAAQNDGPGRNRVKVEGGSWISVGLLTLVQEGNEDEDAAMLEVIEAQLEAIGNLTETLTETNRRLGEAEGYPDEIEARLGKLCIALGYDRIPQMPTGVPELDALVRFVHSE